MTINVLIPSIGKAASSTPTIKVKDAIAVAEKKLNGKYEAENFPAPSLEYVVQEDGSAALAHVFQVRNPDGSAWYEAFIDAHTGDVVSVTDFRSDASVRVLPVVHLRLSNDSQYRVLPITSQAVPDGFQTLVNPQDLSASPYGWHSDGVTNTTNTG